jgi:hypothetical protein
VSASRTIRETYRQSGDLPDRVNRKDCPERKPRFRVYPRARQLNRGKEQFVAVRGKSEKQAVAKLRTTPIRRLGVSWSVRV